MSARKNGVCHCTNRPNDQKIVLLAWKPSDLKLMELAPCPISQVLLLISLLAKSLLNRDFKAKEESKNFKSLLGLQYQEAMTLRHELNEEKKSGGREGGGKATDVKSVLRVQHLQKVALWAGGEASIPSLAAFLGNRLATCGEATGVPLDPSLFPCQKCESILQPGFNCTVRVETNGAKVRRRHNKLCTPTKNVVVYTCHFCSHRNVKKGTSKRHMKEIFASKLKPACKTESTSTDQKAAGTQSDVKGNKEIDKKKVAAIASEPMPVLQSNPNSPAMHTELRKDAIVENSPITPKLTLLEGKRKKRKSSGSVWKEQVDQTKPVTTNAEKVAGGSSKKRKKGWSSLKEIAEKSGSTNSRNLTNLTLPFFI